MDEKNEHEFDSCSEAELAMKEKKPLGGTIQQHQQDHDALRQLKEEKNQNSIKFGKGKVLKCLYILLYVCLNHYLFSFFILRRKKNSAKKKYQFKFFFRFYDSYYSSRVGKSYQKLSLMTRKSGGVFFKNA